MTELDTTQQVDVLRAELKAWEKSNSVNGQKPSRETIKQHPHIATKYSEFQKLKDRLAAKVVQDSSASTTSTVTKIRKRKHEAPNISTPSKPVVTAPTPSSKRQSLMPYDLDPYDSPSMIRKLFTPSATKHLGPTPQKDGVPLGIFDLLSEVETPIITRVGEAPSQATPSKQKSITREFASTHKHSRTPNSSGKKHMLDAFLTPSHRLSKLHDVETPKTVSKLDFGTPSFLRRGGITRSKSLGSIQEKHSTEATSPEVIRLPRKIPLMRVLSSIAADLRRTAEEAAEEDLDILREMENDASAPSSTKPVATLSIKNDLLLAKTAITQVEDSQPPLPGGLLGGFDDIAMFDSEPEVQQDRGQPLKIYKKKGQKRTTRRSNLKPVRPKSSKVKQSSTTHITSDSDTDFIDELHDPPDLDTNRVESPSETIANAPEGFKPDARNFDTDSSGSEYTASEGGTRYRRAKQKRKKSYDEEGKEKKAGRARKVGAVSAQNFKRLKLRNNGAKGGPGIGSRFRRRK